MLPRLGIVALALLLLMGSTIATTGLVSSGDAVQAWLAPIVTSLMVPDETGEACMGDALIAGAPVPADRVASVEITGSFEDCRAVPSSVTVTFTDGTSVTSSR